MKPNVDLTLDRVFSSALRTRSLSILSTLLRGDYPWSFNTLENTLSYYNQIFHTGNKKERANKKQDDHYCNGDYGCDRCGMPLNVKPWDSYGLLCGYCNELVSDSFYNQRQGKYPWSFKQKEEILLWRT